MQSQGEYAPAQECFIRQVYQPGMDCEFDWGEFYLTIGGRRTKVYTAGTRCDGEGCL